MIPIASGTAVSTAANTTADVTIPRTYQTLPKGRLFLACKGSAAGMQINLYVGGAVIAKSAVLFKTGTAGTLDLQTDVMVDQNVAGGVVEFQLVNTTGGALTTDYYLGIEPTK